jgi:hypothetical protein
MKLLGGRFFQVQFFPGTIIRLLGYPGGYLERKRIISAPGIQKIILAAEVTDDPEKFF